ncbi:MAG TPA: hypothetical protein VKB17_06615 [Thermoleophilaceae bacterium]|nr:hypothetical protein [Thermoleophilaceae bacterium]
MSEDSRPDRPPADLEIVGRLRAAEARWQRKAHSETSTTGDLETEELRNHEPEEPDRGQTYRNVRRMWQFRARLADAFRRQPS